MNRSKFIDRIYLEQSPEGEHGRIKAYADQGSEGAITSGTILASFSSEEFMQTLVSHKAMLDEWGGEIFISAIRKKFDRTGNLIEHREPGEYQTIGYVIHYGHRSGVKGQVHEPDTPLAETDVPAPAEADSPNGVPDPEPVEA